MAVEFELEELMPDTLTWYPMKGMTQTGNRAYGDGTSVTCRVELKRRRMTRADGQQIMSEMAIYTSTDHGIKPDDKIVLANGRIPEIKAVESFSDTAIGYYQVLYA